MFTPSEQIKRCKDIFPVLFQQQKRFMTGCNKDFSSKRGLVKFAKLKGSIPNLYFTGTSKNLQNVTTRRNIS